jgi:hypothetical protein
VVAEEQERQKQTPEEGSPYDVLLPPSSPSRVHQGGHLRGGRRLALAGRGQRRPAVSGPVTAASHLHRQEVDPFADLDAKAHHASERRNLLRCPPGDGPRPGQVKLAGHEGEPAGGQRAELGAQRRVQQDADRLRGGGLHHEVAVEALVAERDVDGLTPLDRPLLRGGPWTKVHQEWRHPPQG